jgi:hypothetical protein
MQELLSLFVGDDRSTSLTLPEVLPALTGFTGTGFTGIPVVNRATVQAAGRQSRAAYYAFIVSS